jgi:hypothetical protein
MYRVSAFYLASACSDLPMDCAYPVMFVVSGAMHQLGESIGPGGGLVRHHAVDTVSAHVRQGATPFLTRHSSAAPFLVPCL